jgi:exopolysaccharide biosynthesis polyprenyl glycosylphosphotransferase
MDSGSTTVSSTLFFREKNNKYCEKELVVSVGKESSRRDHATGIRTAVEIVCFLMDALLVLAGHLAGFWVRFYSGWATGPLFTDTEKIPTVGGYLSHFVLGGILFSLLLVRAGAYRRNALLRRQAAFQSLSKAAFQWVVLYLLVSLFFKLDPPIARTFVLISGLLIIPLLFAGRMMVLRALHRSVFGDRLRTRLLVVGWNEQAGELAMAQSQKESIHPVHLVGWVPLPGQNAEPEARNHITKLGNLEDVENLLVTGDFDGVLLADVSAGAQTIGSLRDLCYRENADFLVVPNVFEVLLAGLHLEMLGKVPVLGTDRLPLDSTLNRCLKRGLDIVGALVGLAVFAPVMLVAAFLVWAEKPGPVIYRQVRSGRFGRNFRMMKIRTMIENAEGETGPKWATEKDDRRLWSGPFLRKWNIDELPQFWHVLTGEMTLVGPRPERPEFIRKFKHEIRNYNVRHAAKPGMTGWAQVNGLRGNTSLQERVQADLWYLENWSVALDLYIMFATVFKKQKNAY